MNKAILQKLSVELKIAPERFLREFWEITLLNEISNEKWSTSLGFKGGTALRLAYGSPRFSDDLDFSLIGRLNVSKIFAWAKGVIKKFKIELTDEAEKRNTIFVEFRIRDEALAQPIKQKIEISKRIDQKRKQEYELRLLTSTSTNLQVLFPVASLDMLWLDKISALKDRKESRDLFDLWYIAQKLKRQLPNDLPSISGKILKLTLNKYLPLNHQKVIQELARR